MRARNVAFPVQFLVLAVLLALPRVVTAQAQEGVDLNEYYRFPLAIGVEYRSLSPLGQLNVPYSILDISGFATMPLPGMPTLQAFLRGGLASFDSLDSADPLKWDHSQFYGLLGMGISTRFSRNFEAGADLALGAAEAVFPNAVPGGPVGNPYFLAEAGGRVGLDPSYGLSIMLAPRLRWQRSLGALASLDGFLVSVGISASFRFGEDPDSARSLIRSLRFENLKLPQVFPAMKSYYDANKLGSVTLVNTESQQLTDIEVSFFQKGFMDSPTASAKLDSIPPKGRADIPLKAVFNRQVFSVEGSQALTGEIQVSYRRGGRAAEQSQSVTYELEDRRAITWDDDRKVAAFITPQDSALKNYTAFLGRVFKDDELPNYAKPFQYAMELYSGLRGLDLLYQEDPSSPFTRMQGDSGAVDTVNTARETLKRKYGDCDDLTVLFASLLETRNVETGFITVPGHIYPAVNTGLGAESFAEIHPDRSMTIPVDGTLWIPVEVTMLGRDASFMDAWAKGIELWRANEKGRAFTKTRAAQVLYGPVALEERDLGLQYGDQKTVTELFLKDRKGHVDLVVKSWRTAAEKSGAKRDFNKAGIVAATLERFKDAEDLLSRAVKLDPKYLSALVNLGNVYFLGKQYDKAVTSYKAAQAALAAAGPQAASPQAAFAVLANLSKAYAALGRGDQAKLAYAQAEQLDPAKARELAGAAVGAAATGRASEAGDDRRLLFPTED